MVEDLDDSIVGSELAEVGGVFGVDVIDEQLRKAVEVEIHQSKAA